MPERCKIPLWNSLKSAIHDVLQKKNQSKMMVDACYTAYILVLNNYSEKIYTGVIELISDHLNHVVREHILSEAKNEHFLQIVHQHWEDHNYAMGLIRNILHHMVNKDQ